MVRPSRIRLGTEANLQKRFGSDKLQIGFPVRPKPEPEEERDHPAEEQQPERD